MNFHDISTWPLLFPRHFHDVRIRRRVCGPRAPARRFSTAFPRSPSKIHDKSTSRPSTAHFHAISTPSRISMAHFHGVSPIDAVASQTVLYNAGPSRQIIVERGLGVPSHKLAEGVRSKSRRQIIIKDVGPRRQLWLRGRSAYAASRSPFGAAAVLLSLMSEQ